MGADDVVHAVGEDVARHAGEGLVVLELAERDHRADDEGVVGLLDLVQAAAREVDADGDRPVREAKPHHAADDGGEPVLLQEVVGLLCACGASVLLEFEHGSSSVALLAMQKTNFTTAQRPNLISPHVLRCVFAAISPPPSVGGLREVTRYAGISRVYRFTCADVTNVA